MNDITHATVFDTGELGVLHYESMTWRYTINNNCSALRRVTYTIKWLFVSAAFVKLRRAQGAMDLSAFFKFI